MGGLFGCRPFQNPGVREVIESLSNAAPMHVETVRRAILRNTPMSRKAQIKAAHHLLGVSPGTAVTGFPPGSVTGGTSHAGDATATAAQAGAHKAYQDLVAEPCGTNLTGKTLGTSPGAVTLSPGVYCFDSSAQLTGTLTLSGSGVYVFKIGSTLTTASKSSVVLAKGATAGNVFWQVTSSATLGTNTAFEGSIVAMISDTVTTGASVSGRVIALTGSVTLSGNRIRAASK